MFGVISLSLKTIKCIGLALPNSCALRPSMHNHLSWHRYQLIAGLFQIIACPIEVYIQAAFTLADPARSVAGIRRRPEAGQRRIAFL